MAHLLNVTVTPPGGWYFIDPVSGVTIGGGDWNNLIQNIARHRSERGIDPAGIETLVQDQICGRIPKPNDYCDDSLRGLGDLIHRFAHPIAVGIDRVAGTSLRHCGGCGSRRAALNDAVPFK